MTLKRLVVSEQIIRKKYNNEMFIKNPLKEDMERIPMIGRFGVKIFTKLGIFKK